MGPTRQFILSCFFYTAYFNSLREKDSGAVFAFNKKNKNKKKQVLFNWMLGATLKLKMNRNYLVYERGCFLINAPLFTLKFDSFSQLFFLKQ